MNVTEFNRHVLLGHEYWGQNVNFPVSDWQREVAQGDTRLGYWDWVVDQSGIAENVTP
jgi:hypothetical protein